MASGTTHSRSQVPCHSGFSLVELLVVVSIVSILAALAVPSVSTALARSKLRSAGEQLRSDINLARSEAVKRNVSMRMSFNVNGVNWCYGIKANAGCDCTITDSTDSSFCFIDSTGGGTPLSSVVSSSAYPDIVMETSPFGGSLSFSPIRPALDAGSATLTSSTAGGSIRVLASSMGRVRFCSPSASLSGYPAC